MPEHLWKGPLAFTALGIVFALIAGWFIWDFSALNTEQRVRYERTAADYAGQTAQRIERKCGASLQGQAVAECMAEVISTSREDVRAERDLDAQEMMARFTRLMGWTGLFGLFVGIASIILVWRTLLATQQMARDTRQIGEAEVRAYIKIVPEVDKFFEDGPPDPYPSFTLWIENTGQTPAKRIMYHAGVGPKPKELPIPCPDLFTYNDTREAGMELAGGSGIAGSVRSPYSFGQILQGRYPSAKYCHYLFGIVRYEDVFGKKHKMRFAYQIEPYVQTTKHPRVGDDVTMDLRLTTARQHNDEN